MSDFDFRGLGVALVTPFDDKGKVDYNCLEMLVRRLVAGNRDDFDDIVVNASDIVSVYKVKGKLIVNS